MSAEDWYWRISGCDYCGRKRWDKGQTGGVANVGQLGTSLCSRQGCFRATIGRNHSVDEPQFFEIFRSGRRVWRRLLARPLGGWWLWIGGLGNVRRILSIRTPDQSEGFRATYIDEDGPIGHSTAPSLHDLDGRQIFDWGRYMDTPATEDEIMLLTSTNRYRTGADRVAIIQAENAKRFNEIEKRIKI